MPRLTAIRRGVQDAQATATFFAWLLDAEPDEDDGTFSVQCRNGTLLVDGDTSRPVSIELSDAATDSDAIDPDGVPVSMRSEQPVPLGGAAVSLDHVRLNCADLVLTANFYRAIGFECTWSDAGSAEPAGLQADPVDGATWLHLSCEGGYVSLSQADWQDYGRHIASSGPPRFMHIGLAVASLDAVVARLDNARVPYLTSSPEVGRSVYLNDADGDDELGTNIEIIEYLPAMARSGVLTASPAAL